MMISHACRHLIENPESGRCRHFTGKGVQSWLLCHLCREAVLASATAELQELDAEMLERLRQDRYFETVTGSPQVTDRPSPTIGTPDVTVLDGPKLSQIAAMPDFTWLGYTEEGALEILTVDGFRISRRIVAHYHDDRTDLPLRPIVDPTGRFVALVQDHGQFGAVIDLQTGLRTMTLDAGDYHPDQVSFSACFIRHDGKPVLVHRTDWNRLDASNPQTGELLTSREPTSYVDKVRPPHYLDYFHGALHVSPSGRLILDDGWAWHPTGIISTFDAQRWLSTNVWETEDGPSHKYFPSTDEWERGVAWLDDQLIVIENRDETRSSDDAKFGFLFNAQGREIRPIAGLAGRFFCYRGKLFSSDADGLSIWDTHDWARLGFVPGFRPTVHHSHRQELAQLDGDRLMTWRYSI